MGRGEDNRIEDRPAAPRTSAAACLSAGVALWGGLALHGLAGPAAPGVRAASAFGALAFVFLCGLRTPDARSRIPMFTLAAAALAFLPGTPAAGAAYAMAVLAGGGHPVATVGLPLLLASLATAFAGWIPGADALGSAVASAVGDLAAAEGGAETNYGPSAVGLPAALWACALLLARAAHRPGPWPVLGLVLVAAAVFGQWSVVDLLHDRFGVHAGHGHPPGIFRSLDYLPALLGAAVAVGWIGRPAFRYPEPARRPLLAGPAGLGVGALLALAAAGWQVEGEPDRRAVFLNAGGLDWERPTVEELGVYSGGMFGLLPEYLGRAGWQVEALELEELLSFGAGDAGLLVLLNCHHVWSEDERAVVERFLRAGGSLLVLGDHTDVFGMMRGTNSLIAPWGVEYRFDSAYHTGRAWTDDLAWRPGILGAGRDPLAASLAIGASLAVSAPARSLVQARYAFSDGGLRENVAGAFLGDYTYRPGERLGDLCMVAGTRVGRGRVVVFGDTSGFQNSSLPAGFGTHVLPLFDQLARPPHVSVPAWLEVLLVALVLAGAAVSVLRPRVWGDACLGGVAAGLILATLLVPDPWRAALRSPLRSAGGLDPSLVLDYAHFPDVGHYEADWNVVGPLETAAMRAGLLAYRMERWDPEVVARARTLALVQPRRPFSADEVEQLDLALRRGATVLVAASALGGDAVRPLLARYGVELGRSSIGPVPALARQRDGEPRFLEATPLTLAPGGRTQVLYRYGDLVLAAAVQVGGGWLVVVGDARFFSNRNLEGVWGWWGGNLRFVHDVLTDFCGGDRERVRELFPPPRHPDDPEEVR